MKQIERLSYQDIPSLIIEHKKDHKKMVFVELSKLVNRQDEWQETIQELQKASHILKPMTLEEALRTSDTPYLNELLRQIEERDRTERKLIEFWENPLVKNGFSMNEAARDIFYKQRELMVRYLNINLVINSDVKENVIKNQKPGSENLRYRNFKSYWYNEKGEKRLELSFGYGKIEGQRGKPFEKDSEQNLLELLKRFYKKMNYSFLEEPKKIKKRGKITVADLVVQKGNSTWIIEVKKSHAEHYKAMILNFHLWLKYCQTYNQFNNDSWF